MSDSRKEFWVKVFVKKCTNVIAMQQQIDFHIDWCKRTYGVSDECLNAIKEKYTIQKYLNMVSHVISDRFSVEDLQNIVEFYSTPCGKKLLSHKFTKDMTELTFDLNSQIEKSFAKGSNK